MRSHLTDGVRLDRKLTVPPLDIFPDLSDTLVELCNFELDKFCVDVSSAMVLGQELVGLVLSTIRHEPPGRLGDEEDRDDDDGGSECLKNKRDSPRVVAVEIVGAIGDCGRGSEDQSWKEYHEVKQHLHGSSKPATVVQTGASSFPVRRGDLDGVCRSRQCRDGDPEAKDESSNRKLCDGVRSGYDDHSDDDDDGADKHGLSSTVSI